MNKLKNNNKGITLIALVITIVVLVILVGVTVNVAINTGLISTSKTAVSDFDKAQKREELDLGRVAGIMEIQSMKEVKVGEYTGTSNKKYVDGINTAYIPAGFTVSNIDGETNIDGGLVIYGNKSNSSSITDTAEEYMAKIKSGETGYTVETLQATYNQYVWIPVENPSDMYGTDASGNRLGKLYNFGDSTNGFATSPDEATARNWTEDEDGVMSWASSTATREPAYLVESQSADNSKYNVDASGNKIITEVGIKDDFNRMAISLETYKGFYIGRYELTGTVEKPTVVKNATPLKASTSYSVNSKLRWYGLYTMCERVEQNNEDAKGKVTTGMIWGSQWEQVVKKSLTDKNDFLNNAKAYGWHIENSDNVVHNSGTKVSVYNIFDLSGNVFELTLEAMSNNIRVARGRWF